MIEWMRSYNASGAGKIEFAGFDMQDPSLPVDSVLTFLGGADRDYVATATAAYRDMWEAWRTEAYPKRPDRVYAGWIQGAEAVLQHLSSRRDEYLLAQDTLRVRWALQNAAVALQAARHARGGDNVFRDSAMAAKLEWALSVRPAGTRAILWARNGHIARKLGWMGGFLDRPWGGDLRLIGLTAFQGAYSGADDLVRPRFSSTPLFPAPAGSVEHALQRLGVPALVLDLRAAGAEPAGRWLTEPREMRSAGFLKADYGFEPQAVAREYDALVYLEHTNPSRMLVPE